MIGEYLSALANAACLASQPRGYLLFGIDDETHEVVGTRLDSYAAKGKGNQDLLPWLRPGCRPQHRIRRAWCRSPGRASRACFEAGPCEGPARELLR